MGFSANIPCWTDVRAILFTPKFGLVLKSFSALCAWCLQASSFPVVLTCVIDLSQVNETTSVHCGFYSENGFKISDEDKIYMQSCEVVVSTCAFGGGDDLYQPIGMAERLLKKVVTLNREVRTFFFFFYFVVTYLFSVCFDMQVCYVAFWDEITLKTQESEGHMIADGHMIGKWRIVIVRQLPFMDQRLNGKIPKVIQGSSYYHIFFSFS